MRAMGVLEKEASWGVMIGFGGGFGRDFCLDVCGIKVEGSEEMLQVQCSRRDSHQEEKAMAE